MGASKRQFEELREESIVSETETSNGFNLAKRTAKEYEIKHFINELVKRVKEGNQSALDVFISFKQIADYLEKAKKEIDEVAINEAEKYQNETYNGFKVSIVQGRKMFDFKNIKEYSEKQSELKSIEEKYKSALDGVQKGTVQIDGENWIDQNGELLPFPKISYGKSYVKLEKLK